MQIIINWVCFDIKDNLKLDFRIRSESSQDPICYDFRFSTSKLAIQIQLRLAFRMEALLRIIPGPNWDLY